MSEDDLTRAISEARQDIEDLCPHEADEHAEGCCDVCDLAFAAGSVLDDLATALAPLIEARVREAQGPCTCAPWHPGTDGPEEDCAQHGRPYAYWVEYAAVLEGRMADLLCDLTGGLLSKPGYDVPTMAQAVEDHFERTVAADAWDEGYEAGHATARAVNAEYPEEPTNPYRRAES